ncbi:RES family NAD+ phosphorylase [Elioraea tepidiphila]|uniref:RES family NAD+ phosphorylase n=1 Tax=Elioraea tepidiphila TaxID=457934 RepID=UPI002FDB0E73
MRLRRVRWRVSHRIIRTIYPPIDIFEDIADPADWELLVAAEAKLNPRIRDQVGNLALVPVARRVAGPTASIVMGAFTHVSRDRPGRFSDGSYGVWSCGDRFEVALAETAHHFERFMRATNEPAGEADYRELVAAVQGRVADGADPALLAPDDWRPGQAFGKQVREGGGDGVLYPSVRYPAGKALALFWPDCITLPVTQARQFRYSWDGARMHRYLVHGTREWVAYP